MSKDTDFSLDGFSTEASDLFEKAQKFGDEVKSKHLMPGHILLQLLEIAEIRQLLVNLEIDQVSIATQLHAHIAYISKFSGAGKCYVGPATIELFNRTKEEVGGARPANSFDVFHAMASEKTYFVGSLFKKFGLSQEKIEGHLTKGQDLDLDSSNYFTNLSLQVKRDTSEVIIGRDDEVRRLVQILGRRSKHHPILVGESGVGKKTIVLSLVNRIISGDVPKNWKQTTVVQLNTNNLFYGVKGKGEVEARLKGALKAFSRYDVIVYIRSLDSLSNGNASAADLFELFFENPNIRVITASNNSSYKKFLEKDSSLAREFTSINVEPTTEKMAVEILRGIARRYEDHHNIKIGENCIDLAVKLSKKHVQNRWLPESAIDLLDEAASNKMMEVTGVPLKVDKARSRVASLRAQLTGLRGNSDMQSMRAIDGLQTELDNLLPTVEFSLPYEHSSATVLGEESIARVIGEWTGIPVSKFLEGDAEKVAKMSERLSMEVIDQNEAVEAVALAVRRSRAGLRKQQKPIGSFMFLGSSGVGKTLLAKKLASYLFDSEENMTRIDMSEFQEKHMISRLTGSPPGYANSEEGGFLTEAVLKKPYSVVLFDEVEKAHPDIFNILLQVLDDGRLSDSRGKLVDFSNTIIILTSNIGSPKILAACENDPKLFESPEGLTKIREQLNEDINRSFRPEFLNRIDSQVIFKPLSKKSLGAIADIEFRWLEKMLSDRDLNLKVSADARDRLVEMSYFPAFGARPLHRSIMNHIQNPLSEMVLSPNCKSNSTIAIEIDDMDGFHLDLI